MLRRTFIHVPGIGKTTEQSLWRQGCPDWVAYLSGDLRFSTGNADRQAVRDFIAQSQKALDSGHHQFFSRYLGFREAWRAFPDFRSSCAYLDIETDGASITTIGIYDGKEFTCFIKGENLESFRDAISGYSMIVTFCGGAFDLPHLQRQFRGAPFDQIHVDLCPILRKLGFRGGLKSIERELGIKRPAEVDGLTGFDAVVLWRRHYGLGDSAALDRLIAYNRQDCVNLERLADFAFAGMEAITVGVNPIPA